MGTIYIKKLNSCLFLLFSILLTMLIASGCVDLHAYERPTRYQNTKWVSSEPNIYFQVDSNEDLGNIGELDINNHKFIIKMSFDYGSGVQIVDDSVYKNTNNPTEAALITGHCKFSKTKLIVTVDKVSDKISIDSSIKEITFLKKK